MHPARTLLTGICKYSKMQWCNYRTINELTVKPGPRSIRWVCQDGASVPSTFPWTSDGQAFQVKHSYISNPCNWAEEQCIYCGGTFAMLWRGSSVHKLRKIWAELPYDDIDCRLDSEEINIYCVQTGWKFGGHKPPASEDSDIPNGRNTTT